jgi:hypothetical protein
MWERATVATAQAKAHLARLQISSGQLLVVQNADYLDSIVDFPVVDDVAQRRVLPVPCPDMLAALAKSGIAGQKVERGRQVVNVSFSMFEAPL